MSSNLKWKSSTKLIYARIYVYQRKKIKPTWAVSKMPDVNLFLPQTGCFSNKAWIVIWTSIRSTDRIKTVSTAVYIAYTPGNWNSRTKLTSSKQKVRNVESWVNTSWHINTSFLHTGEEHAPWGCWRTCWHLRFPSRIIYRIMNKCLSVLFNNVMKFLVILLWYQSHWLTTEKW